jgi:hypothetical protein
MAGDLPRLLVREASDLRDERPADLWQHRHLIRNRFRGT